MNDLIEELKAKLLHATELIQQIASERNRRTGRSPNTEHDYLRLGQTLLMRAKTTDGGLIGAVSDTRRPTTFQKRIAALRFTLQSRQLELLDSIVEPVTTEMAQKWLRLLNEQIEHMKSVIELRQQGLVGQRARRRSKRVALGGLPPDWREQLCQRGGTGRYADALLLVVPLLLLADFTLLSPLLKASVSTADRSWCAATASLRAASTWRLASCTSCSDTRTDTTRAA